jgi:hypothetical protein
MLPVPDDAVPIDANVAVPDPPVPVGNVTLAAGLTAFEVTVQPTLVRATETRA